jgi:Family of unknown function (DUF5808)
MKRKDKIVLGLLGLLVGSAVSQQLLRPPEGRTWQGRILGIPYDFRPPTWDRVRASFWNKDNPSVLAPHAFGIGWTVNLYRLLPPEAHRR